MDSDKKQNTYEYEIYMNARHAYLHMTVVRVSNYKHMATVQVFKFTAKIFRRIIGNHKNFIIKLKLITNY